MSVTSQIPRKVSTAAPGATLFPYDFKVLSKFDMEVQVDGVTKTVDVDYTLTGVGLDAGGDITFLAPLAGGETVMRRRAMSYERANDFQQLGDLRSPTLNNDQDAPIMMIQQVADDVGRSIKLPVSSTGSGDVSNFVPLAPLVVRADGNGIEGGDTALTGDMLLRPNLAAPDGGSFVGFNETTVYAKLARSVDITDFGGVADGVTNNDAALTAAKAAAGAGGQVRFPLAGTGVYVFNSDLLGGVVIDADEGVTLQGPLSLQDTYKFKRAVKLAFSSNNTHDTVIPNYKRPAAEKSIYLSANDADRSELGALATNTGFLYEKNDFPNSDTWADDSANFIADGPRVVFNSVPNDGDLRAATCVVSPGDEIAVSFGTPAGTYQRFAIVRTTNGFQWVRVDASAVSYIGAKLLSTAVAESPFVPLGSTSQDNFKPRNATWSIRIYDRNHFSVLFNGIEVTGIITTAGDIVRAGFGIIPTSVAVIDTQGWVRWSKKDQGGKRDVQVLVCGDSLSIEHHGGWTGFFREAVEGAAGIRVKKMINYAVSGDISTQQRNKLLSLGTQGSSHVVIFVGTNDIQLGATPTDTQGIIGEMLDFCDANSAIPIVCVPPQYYAKSLTTGGASGENTLRYAEGAETRARIMRLCASRGVKCVDMTQVTGPVLVEYLNDTTLGIDAFVRDNVHPTTFGNKVIGFAIARAFLGSYLRTYARKRPPTALPAAGYLNSWTNLGSRLPQYSISEDGIVHLRGLISGGTTTSGTAMYNLPAHLRPPESIGFACASSSAGTTPIVEIDAAGDMKLYGGSGLSYVYLDGISYQL